MTALTIGALSRDTGVKVPTIRFYEQIGLVPEPARSDNNRRAYGPEAIRRLRFVRHARELGFEVDAIRQLLAMAQDPDRSCGEAHEITRAHLDEVEDKIARLSALRDELKAMVTCDSRKIAKCRIIEVLADHEEGRRPVRTAGPTQPEPAVPARRAVPPGRPAGPKPSL